MPQLTGTVEALAPGPDGQSVFAGGSFNSVNGDTGVRRLVRLTIANGQAVAGFRPNPSAVVLDLVVRGSWLYVSGQFQTIGGASRGALARLNPVTGAVDPNLNLPFSGPMNGGGLSARKIDVTPDGTKLVAIGNFSQLAGQPRNQMAIIDLPPTGPATVSSWQTSMTPFVDPANPTVTWCSPAFFTWMRDLDISPDGQYFVLVTTGAYRANRLCDSVSRWETSATGPNQQPTWIDWAGGDTFWGVGVTGAAIYAGGHQRWMNNPYRGDNPGPGAVPREGIAALDPINGLPLTWDPGRDRGVGVFTFPGTPDGLWVGSDTDHIGGELHQKLAFFPVVGGTAIPPNNPYGLPNDLYQMNTASGNLVRRAFDGTTFSPPTTVPAGIDWRNARGAFALNGLVYSGLNNGTLNVRTFDGTTFGAPATVNLNGLDVAPPTSFRIPGTTTPVPAFSTHLANMTGMFFDGGRIYYTVSGNARLYYRYFTPESRTVGANLFVASTGDGVNWANVRGMTMASGNLYLALTGGNLYKVAWSGGHPTGGVSQIGGPLLDGVNWTSQGLFAFAHSNDATPPTTPGKPSGASAGLDSIQLSWAASSDPSGPITYRIYRDGNATPVGQVVSSSTTTVGFTDSGLISGSSHTYTVDARDTANNTSVMSAVSDPITVQTQGGTPPIFADDFSSGTLANWTGVTRLTIDAGQGGTAPPSARAQVTGQSAFGFRTLAGTVSTVCMSMRVNVVASGGSRVLLRLRTAANGPISRVWVNAAGTLWVRSDVSNLQLSSGVALGTGWHAIEFCGTVGTSGTWDLYRDGVKIVNAWVADTGTTPVGRVEIGDTAAGTFTVNFDDVVVDQAPG